MTFSSGPVRPVLIVSTSELMVKGGKRQRWLKLLKRNLEEFLGEKAARVELRQARILVHAAGEDLRYLARKLALLPGVRWVGIGYELARDYQLMLDLAEKIASSASASKVSVRVQRSDKSFPKTSLMIMRDVEARLVQAFSVKIDPKEPELSLWLNVLPDSFLLAWERVEGVGGLPVGASGRVLALLSGGIDSPVAAWLMMKRGCVVDMLHVYAQTTPEEALTQKMRELFLRLKRFCGDSRLFLVPYDHFLASILKGDTRLELVLFRKFLYKLAEYVAKEIGALAVVSGDSLGQAASQTLESIHAASHGLGLQVMRPLIGMDKEEIVKLSKSLGLFELATKEYKDCCSIIRRPLHRPMIKDVEREWMRLDLDKAVYETLRETVVFDGEAVHAWKALSRPMSHFGQE